MRGGYVLGFRKLSAEEDTCNGERLNNKELEILPNEKFHTV
jgi:hypothetical protein